MMMMMRVRMKMPKMKRVRNQAVLLL